jgi:signal transduction histidine kinase
LSMAHLIANEDQNVFYLHRRKILDTRAPQSCEIRMRRKDGSSFWADLECTPVFDENDNVTHIRIVIADITERKQIEEQLVELNACKDKFIEIISHDLRSPFTGIFILVEQIAQDVKSQKYDWLSSVIAQLQASMEKYQALLENLLTWAKVQQGIIEYFPLPVDLHLIFAKNIALFIPTAKQKQITLRSSIQERMVLYADINMLDTVVRNLLSNAIKFTEPSGTVEVSATPGESHVTVAVSDTGIGIHNEKLPKLFRIDAKYQRTGTAGEKGTGLGLILCKEFVEKHDGRIWVESEVGKGTTVRFTLPKSPELSDSKNTITRRG